MAPEFTTKELVTICGWAMEACDKAKKKMSYWPEPYEEAKTIFDKAFEERTKREREG